MFSFCCAFRSIAIQVYGLARVPDGANLVLVLCFSECVSQRVAGEVFVWFLVPFGIALGVMFDVFCELWILLEMLVPSILRDPTAFWVDFRGSGPPRRHQM